MLSSSYAAVDPPNESKSLNNNSEKGGDGDTGFAELLRHRKRHDNRGMLIVGMTLVIALIIALVKFKTTAGSSSDGELPSSAPPLVATVAPNNNDNDLIMTAILHAQLPKQLPKAMELYACAAIPDLSVYVVETFFNGANTTNTKYRFPKGSSATAGQYIYLATDAISFQQYFGFNPDYISKGAVNYNGNDVPTLWRNDVMVDIYGVIGVDGTGKSWDYTAGWAARNSGATANATFQSADWTVKKGALKRGNTNAAAASPVPIKTFKCTSTTITPAPPTPAAPVASAPPVAVAAPTATTSSPVAPPPPSPPSHGTVPVVPTATTAPVGGDGHTLVKVMSYNIQMGGANPAWKDVVKEENPDIAVFVEVGNWDDNHNRLLNHYVSEFNKYFKATPATKSKAPYQGSVAQGTAVKNTGVALLSRFPIVNTTQLNSVTLDNGTSFKLVHPLMVWAINVNGRIVYVCGFYEKCCNGYDDTRERTMEGFINYLDSLGHVPVFIMGDFNAVSPSDTDNSNPDFIPAFLPAPASNLGDGPLAMLLYPNDPTYGVYSSRDGIHEFTDTFRKINHACGVSHGQCCPAAQCGTNRTTTTGGGSGSRSATTTTRTTTTCMERGYSFHDGKYDSRIDFIIANQFITVQGPSTVGDTTSACIGSDHFAVDNYFVL